MKVLPKLVLGLNITAFFTTLLGVNVDICENNPTSNPKDLPELLKNIYKERYFESMVLLTSHTSLISHSWWNSKAIFEWKVPKIILAPGQEFELRKVFNKDIIAVVFMPSTFDSVLFDSCAQLLNNTRQSRIVVATSDSNMLHGQFQQELLQSSAGYKMARLLLAFLNVNGGELCTHLKLQPYPTYRWQCPTHHGYFYPDYWRNLHKKAVVVYGEQSVPRVFLFKDAMGNIQYSGHIGRLVRLFVQHYNATMQPYQPPVEDNSTFYTKIGVLVKQNLVDIPMTLDYGKDGHWHLNSDFVEVTQVKLMVPCPRPLAIQELYPLMLNFDFFGSLIFCTILFSFLHTLIDAIVGEIVQACYFFLDDKALPSILGQSFKARLSPVCSLKLLYLIMFFTGLHTSLHFAAKMKTLFTTPPYRRHLKDFDELNRSPVKILVYENFFSEPPYPIEKLIITKDYASFQEMQQNFNTSFGYYTTTTTWQIYKRQQQGISHKIFCMYNNLTITSKVLGLRLPSNSELKEPMDELIQRARDLGLMKAWYSMTFGDMLKHNELQLHHGDNVGEASALTASDLSWLWIISAMGLMIGTVMDDCWPVMANV
ncbi:uncharacterized protein LOC131994851 [Stomoxys calcitrans]|uniref:uncharacterized protein LOC131994851 n=1 Tax=Stomoxys calcitrans TaxID=35570 RepID=UPI0027E38BA2|nr:uncharacterized protein LOC131994851 [Stomoxys calcitrans]